MMQKKLALSVISVIMSTITMQSIAGYELGDTGVTISGALEANILFRGDNQVNGQEAEYDPEQGKYVEGSEKGWGDFLDTDARLFFNGRHPTDMGDFIWKTHTRASRGHWRRNAEFANMELWAGFDNKKLGEFRYGWMYSNVYSYVVASVSKAGMGRFFEETPSTPLRYGDSLSYKTPILGNSFQVMLQHELGSRGQKPGDATMTVVDDNGKTMIANKFARKTATEAVFAFAPNKSPFSASLGLVHMSNAAHLDNIAGGIQQAVIADPENGFVGSNSADLIALAGKYNVNKNITLNLGYINENIKLKKGNSFNGVESGDIERNTIGASYSQQLTKKDSVALSITSLSKLKGKLDKTQEESSTIKNALNAVGFQYTRAIGANISAYVQTRFTQAKKEADENQYKNISPYYGGQDGRTGPKTSRILFGVWAGF